MALWDSADLLARCKREAYRPATDQETSDTDWYAFLTEAQETWIAMLATHVPESQYGAQELLTTTDGGLTYTFANYPLGHAELRSSRTGRLLRPGPEWDPACDFVPEGQTIRFPGHKTKSFPDGGPYARYVSVPGAISASLEPVLKPGPARMLLVHHAVWLWARRGGLRDPAPYEEALQACWAGNPNLPGDVGWLGALKSQFLFAGAAAWPAGSSVDNWWRTISDGSDYTPA